MKASYDAEVAKAYGIPAAVLLYKIAYLQKYSKREDGFCWKTAEEIEEETGLTPKQQRGALAKLETAGLIETKTTAAGKKSPHVRHFRLTEEGARLAFEKCQKVTFKSDKRSTLKVTKGHFSTYIELNNRINTRASGDPGGAGRAARGKKEQMERERELEAKWTEEFEARKRAAGDAFSVIEGGKE